MNELAIQLANVWIQILTVVAANFAIIWWFRKESREDWKIMHQENKEFKESMRLEMREFKEIVRIEMKDFHERLLEIEKNRK